MTRQPRNLPAERSAIEAATTRLLAGTPLRSRSGKLTVSELITESGLRRDVVYADHFHLVEVFRTLAKAQNSTPTAMKDLADENADLTQRLAASRAELAEERAAAATLRRLVVELSLELSQAQNQERDQRNVARLVPPRTDPHLVGPC
ncbi:conserved hypothetical protein [Parafrankia sp. EAN1pec]|uniref:hypothetical protein n=1 Tax=Parafrankia sp. (strain EAN1pec) TaxID=298653 RepID=UPI0000543BB8|nr:conserved hypothetical protein [Frankia sp. EAN1pec]